MGSRRVARTTAAPAHRAGGHRPVRAAVRPDHDLLSLQRTAGNRAVALVIQRSLWDDLVGGVTGLVDTATKAVKKLYREMEKKSESATGEQADQYLSATPLIRAFVQKQVEARDLTVAGSLRVDDDVTFTREYVAFTLELKDPSDDEEMATVDEAIARAESVAGFTADDVIHVHKDRAKAGTVIHESLHLYASDAFRKAVRKQVDEGVTEYFTREVCVANGILRNGVYTEQLASVGRLVDKLPGGAATLASALFDGDHQQLRQAFDAGAGGDVDLAAERYRAWRKRMQNKRFAEADALLDAAG